MKKRRFSRTALVLKLVLLVVLAGAAAEASESADAEEEEEIMKGDDSECLKGLLDTVREQEQEEDSSSVVSTWTATALASPCKFTSTLRGISCSNSRVAVISLPGANLAGTLPSSLSMCNYLQRLDLSSNSLTGVLPHALGELSHLSTLSLSNNQLSGPIPFELAMCVSLTWLDLHQNQLSGSIPGQVGLLPLQYFDVSNNNLSGRIPSTLSNTSTRAPRFNASSFAHNPKLYGFPLSPYPFSPLSPSPQNAWDLSVFGIVGIAVASGITSLIVVYYAFAYFFDIRGRERERDHTRKKSLGRDDGEENFGWKDVLNNL